MKTLAGWAATFLIFCASLTNAQQLEVLHHFTASPRHPVGKIVKATNGFFYGVSTYGGRYDKGAVFRFNEQGEWSTVASFNGQNGSEPKAGLTVAKDGNLYGTTALGGEFGLGTVFKMTPDGLVTTLVSFRYSPGEGRQPFGGLVQASDGYFYGTTHYGGARTDSKGTIFRMTATGSLTQLWSFDRTTGCNPRATLVQGFDGLLYGTTSWGGDLAGVAFKISLTGIFTKIHDFSTQPSSLCVGKYGNIFVATPLRYF